MQIDYIGQLAIYSCRYAQHRKTGAACQVVNSIIALKDQLTEEVTLRLIIESCEASTNEEDWARLRKELNKQVRDK